VSRHQICAEVAQKHCTTIALTVGTAHKDEYSYINNTNNYLDGGYVVDDQLLPVPHTVPVLARSATTTTGSTVSVSSASGYHGTSTVVTTTEEVLQHRKHTTAGFSRTSTTTSTTSTTTYTTTKNTTSTGCNNVMCASRRAAGAVPARVLVRTTGDTTSTAGVGVVRGRSRGARAGHDSNGTSVSIGTSVGSIHRRTDRGNMGDERSRLTTCVSVSTTTSTGSGSSGSRMHRVCAAAVLVDGRSLQCVRSRVGGTSVCMSIVSLVVVNSNITACNVRAAAPCTITCSNSTNNTCSTTCTYSVAAVVQLTITITTTTISTTIITTTTGNRE